MPMIDIQRRHAEVFRLRFGEKGPDGYPRKLTEAIRVTAPTEQIVSAFVDCYGGNVRPFKEPTSRDRFEAYLPTTSIAIMVLPGNSLQQWWERYRRSVCDRRCDGQTEQQSGKPCMCPPDIDTRIRDKNACSPMTRVSVLCPDVAVVGSGSFVSHGLIAAETLPQSIAVAEAALSRGLMVPATLMISEVRGRNHFIYPQIAITGMSLHELVGGSVGATAELGATNGERQLVAAPPAALPTGNLTPVPTPTEAERVLIPSVRAQLTAVDDPSARESKQTPIPRTGLKPRTVAEITGPGGTGDREAPAEPTSDNPPGSSTEPPAVSRAVGDGTGDADGGSAPSVGEPANRGVTVRDVAMKAGAVFKTDYDAAPNRTKTRTVERLRHALIHACTKGEHASLNDLSGEQLVTVLNRLNDITEGRITYRHEQTPTGGVTFTSASGKETTVLWTDIEPEDAA